MRKLILILVGTWFISAHVIAQNNLKKIQGTGVHTSDEVYVNERGEYFAKVFYIAFEEHIAKDVIQTQSLRSTGIKSKFNDFKESVSELEDRFGLQKFEREFQEAVPYDTIRYSKKGKRVAVSDLSKRYKLVFKELQSFEKIKKQLDSENIRYIEPPKIIFSTSQNPNDPYYENQWTHKILESEKVFDITKGDDNIVIGISDLWTSNSTYGVHEELEGRIVAAQNNRKYVPGGNNNYSHGPRIAIIAAGTNNNNKGIASLGGNMKVITAQQSSGLPYFINLPPSMRPDVVNMSWTTSDYQSLQDYIEDLLDLGVVLVGTSVNDIWWDPYDTGNPYWPGQSTLGEPFIPYPASYNFPSKDYQVISVTATQITDDVWNFDPLEPPIDPFQYEERFRWQEVQGGEFIFNYGLDNDPINNPDSAFTDVAAPAGWIFTARGEYATETGSQNEYRAGGGATSEAAPLVTSIVGMMLSVNPDLKGDPQGVYDIITSTTDYDNIVVPSNAVTNTLPDARKYNKYVGFGRVNAYKAVLASVPKITSDVTSNTTWSGYVHLENTIEVDNNATLTVEPGTTVFLSENVLIRVRPGSKIIAEGTEDKPIRFMRADPSKKWNKITLQSSAGNSFEWVVFDGGDKNVDIASKNNMFTHITSRNGWRGLSGWHNQDGSGNSSAEISYALIEDNTSVGVVSHYLDLDMSYTTIRNNAQAGLYVLSNTVYPFHHNLITGNGGSYRDGIEVLSSGTLYMQESTYAYGYNEVFNNGDDQISSSGNLLIAPPPYLGYKYNSIHGNYPTSGKFLVDNNSGTTVDAFYTWWGEYPLQSGMFDGPIDTYGANFFSSDPTNGVAHGAGGQVPAKALPGSNAEEKRPITEIYHELEEKLNLAETNQEVRDGLHRLYQLADMSRKENPELRDWFQNLTKHSSSRTPNLYSSASRNKTFRNTVTVLQAKSLIGDGEYGKAKTWLSQTKAEELEGYDRRDWLHLQMVTQIYHGEYETAWKTLQEYYAFQKSQGEDMEEVRAKNSPIEETLRMLLEPELFMNPFIKVICTFP